MNIIHYRKPEASTWSPFDRLTNLQDEMNRLFESSFGDRASNLFGGWAPPIDVHQDNDNLTVVVELPGMKKEEIEISLHEGSLTISGERKNETQQKEGDQFRSERFFGRFQRTVHLPSAVDAAKVGAAYKDGVLTVTLPKAEEAKPKQIPVSVS